MTLHTKKNKLLVFVAVILLAITWLFNNEHSNIPYNYPSSLTIINSKGETHDFDLITAATPEQRAKGLMNVKHLDKDSGMLFLFESPRQVSFWMKDTYIPLDMLFFNEKGVIVNIYENAKPLSLEHISSKGAVSRVLEINGGQSKARNIKAGDIIVFQPKQIKPSSHPNDE
jgi:uncharacterized membrane protein (UPF0127 family)